MTARDESPDLIGFQGKPSGFGDYCEQGAFLALDDYEEFLPDYNAFRGSVPEDKVWMKNIRKSAFRNRGFSYAVRRRSRWAK